LAWLYAELDSPNMDALFERVVERGAWVPGLWRLEIANALQVAVRRGRIDAGFRDDALSDLAALSITVDLETAAHAWGATLQLAIGHSLTVYDAAFLELAQRRRLPLATLDRELRAAAEAAGVAVLPGF
jgi:predicted nucleic acid-binding protein